jgi:hypothetical protein
VVKQIWSGFCRHGLFTTQAPRSKLSITNSFIYHLHPHHSGRSRSTFHDRATAFGNSQAMDDIRVPNYNVFVQGLSGLQPVPSPDWECAICQLNAVQGVQNGNPVRVCSGNHMFHRECIMKWLQSSQKQRDLCPLCQQLMCRMKPLTQEAVAAQRPGANSEYVNAGMSTGRPDFAHLHSILFPSIGESSSHTHNPSPFTHNRRDWSTEAVVGISGVPLSSLNPSSLGHIQRTTAGPSGGTTSRDLRESPVLPTMSSSANKNATTAFQNGVAGTQSRDGRNQPDTRRFNTGAQGQGAPAHSAPQSDFQPSRNDNHAPGAPAANLRRNETGFSGAVHNSSHDRVEPGRARRTRREDSNVVRERRGLAAADETNLPDARGRQPYGPRRPTGRFNPYPTNTRQHGRRHRRAPSASGIRRHTLSSSPSRNSDRPSARYRGNTSSSRDFDTNFLNPRPMSGYGGFNHTINTAGGSYTSNTTITNNVTGMVASGEGYSVTFHSQPPAGGVGWSLPRAAIPQPVQNRGPTRVRTLSEEPTDNANREANGRRE